MISIKAKKREKLGRKTRHLRERGIIPAVLYGEGVKSTPVEIDGQEFKKVFEEAGMSSLILFELDGESYQVLIHDVSRDPVTGNFLHVDFYRPSTKKEITAEVPLIFEGEEEVQKESGGNVLREIQMIEVKGLAQKLPREIKVDLRVLKNFEDRIQVKDLKMPEGVRILRDKEDIIAILVPPREEEAEQPIEGEEPVGEKPAAGEGSKEERKEE